MSLDRLMIKDRYMRFDLKKRKLAELFVTSEANSTEGEVLITYSISFLRKIPHFQLKYYYSVVSLSLEE